MISGGYNVYPKEVESEIDAIEGVAESAVIGVPHPDFGEGVVAAVVKTKAGLTEADILEPLKKRLANYKLPKRVVFVESLPRNTMGKVQKNLLRDEYRESLLLDVSSPAPIIAISTNAALVRIHHVRREVRKPNSGYGESTKE